MKIAQDASENIMYLCLRSALCVHTENQRQCHQLRVLFLEVNAYNANMEYLNSWKSIAMNANLRDYIELNLY